MQTRFVCGVQRPTSALTLDVWRWTLDVRRYTSDIVDRTLDVGHYTLNNITPFDYASLIRPDIRAAPPAQWPLALDAMALRLGMRVDELAKLDSNENLWGPSPKVREAIANFDRLQFYPDAQYAQLRAALAQHSGAPLEKIVVSNGLDEMIDLLTRLLVAPGDAVLDCPPSFEVYAWAAEINHARTIRVPRVKRTSTALSTGFTLDLDAIERAFDANGSIKLLWLTTPHNPDGSLLTRAELERLLKLPTFVVVDETYVDFAPHSFVELTAEHENLIILRTFSKAPALAGIRFGYAVLPRVLAEHYWKLVAPFNVNTLAVVAARAALDDWDYTRDVVAQMIDEREKLFEELHQFSFLQPYRSHASFILCNVVGRSAAELKDALAQHGVLVRLYDNADLRNHIRISIGTPRETQMLLSALSKI